MKIQQANKSDYLRIMAVWESAVRVTHDFLKSEDFEFYKKIIPNFFSHVDLYVLRSGDNIFAFMGIADDNLEMLFVSDVARGKGFGKLLLEYAVENLHVTKVDVNEQNQQAIGFYEKFGFKTVGRSEKDSMGKDYPILHMSLEKQVMNKITIREIKPEEIGKLEDIMYEAIYHPDPANPYPKEVIYYPQVRVYWDNWGESNDDYCLMAVVDDKIAGAVWIRKFAEELKGCGYINEETPELAVALFKEYRNKGLGTQMMKLMIEWMKRKGYGQVSLSITKGNPAIRLYERLGFDIVDENEVDYIMLLKLKD